MNDVEVVVLDLDGGAMLLECIDSLARQSSPPRRIIVVDNGSDEPVATRVAGHRWLFEVTLLRSEENLGFTGGVNLAMQQVTAPFVALINNDVVLDPGWMESLRRIFDADVRLAAAQSVIRSADGSVDGAGVVIAEGRIVQQGHGRPIAELDPVAPWGVSATAALFRSAALRDVAIRDDVLHPAFFAYYEDVELAARLAERGWRV
ncbi:MAG: glycosyltransferase family 2 protein, partial [Thermoanaerobaculia bacterium]